MKASRNSGEATRAERKNKMKTECNMIAKFIDRRDPEVSGRSSAPLSEDEISKIQRFASGALSADEREAILPGILENEKALNELVQALGSSK